MSTSALPRHLLKWVLSLDLTYPIKHPKRDFANGFLVAEVLSKYFPDDIQMHSFENVTSILRKKSNWHLLKRFFKRYDVPINQDDVDQVMAAADGAIVKVLQAIYDYVHEDAEAQAVQQQAEAQDAEQHDAVEAYSQVSSAMQQPAFSQVAAPQYMQPGSLPYMQQPYAQPSSAAYLAHQQPPASYFSSGNGYPPGPGFYPPGPSQQGPTAGWPQQQMPMQQAPHVQQMYNSNQGMPQHMQHAAGMGAEAYQAMPQMQMGTTYYADPNVHNQHGDTGVPSIEYDRRPRAVAYKPYTQQDYSSRNYDAKTQKEYWQLGTLGPQIEDEDLQAKRKKAEELKELARSIRDKNARLASMATAASRPKADTPKSKSVREKALEFARSVPRPEMKRAASTGSSSGESTPKHQSRPSGTSEIERLQAQHAEHRKRVESIRQEFVRMASS